MARIDAFLKLGAAQGCSDVHLAVGVPPMLRMNGDLLPIKFRNLAEANLEGYVTEQALDGLFEVIAEQEAGIRQNPAGAATSLAKKVFGVL